MQKKHHIVLTAALLLAVTLPYLLGWVTGGDKVFSGFLLNPLDGNTYLAKMNQGWHGAWKFTLPYSAEPGEGAYLNLFYLFLGHVSRLSGLPVVFMYHAARVAGAALLAWSLIQFFRKVVFPGRPGLAIFTAWLALFGSGMGWLAALGGYLPSDFWVAETYPFLSSFVNPHFPTGLAILTLVLLLTSIDRRAWHYPMYILAGLLLAIISPFALAVAALVLAGAGIMTVYQASPSAGFRYFSPLAALLLSGGPYLAYLIWETQTDPVLSIWNAQNLTLSPPIWDLLLSLSPAFPLACLGAFNLWRQKEHPARPILLAWFVLGALLAYAPVSLQRRFLAGYYIPVAALAGFGLAYLQPRLRGRWLAPALLGLSLATNLFLLLGGVLAVAGQSDKLFLRGEEFRALEWLRSNAPEDSLVLASPEIGNYIPAWTRSRVIYGHPFETVHADVEVKAVRDFYSGALPENQMADFLAVRGVDYILLGGRERALNEGTIPLEQKVQGAVLVHQEGEVSLYALRSNP